MVLNGTQNSLKLGFDLRDDLRGSSGRDPQSQSRVVDKF